MSDGVKYCLFGGNVYNINNQVHWVSAHKLADLYGLKRGQYIIAPRNMDGWRIPEGVIPLRPKPDGSYVLPI